MFQFITEVERNSLRAAGLTSIGTLDYTGAATTHTRPHSSNISVQLRRGGFFSSLCFLGSFYIALFFWEPYHGAIGKLLEACNNFRDANHV